MIESKWYESLTVGAKYLYREEGGQTIAQLIGKSLTGDWCDVNLRSLEVVRAGRCGAIAPGDEWTSGAALTETGNPHGMCGWTLEPV